MRCERARYLIHAQAEGLLRAADEQRLRTHVAACAGCTAYAGRAESLLREIELDAEVVLESATLSEGFQNRLRDALAQETRAVGACELPRGLAASVQAWLGHRGAAAGYALGGALATLALALVLCSASLLLRPPAQLSQERRFDHIAAFSIQRSADGRVYAALTQHESAGRWNPSEAHTR